MAIIKIHLDTRTVRKDGTSPLKMNVFHKGKTVMIGLNAYVPIQNWDENNSKVIGLPNRTTLNAYLFQRRVDAEKDRMVEGKGSAKTIRIINEYIDEHESQLLDIWEKAQKGDKIEKVKR